MAIARRHEETQTIREALDHKISYKTPLSHIALSAARLTDGVTTVLTGMRQVSYLKDAIDSTQGEFAVKTRDLFECLEPIGRQFKRRNSREDDETNEQL